MDINNSPDTNDQRVVNTEQDNPTPQNQHPKQVLALLVIVAVLAVGGYLIYGKQEQQPDPASNQSSSTITEEGSVTMQTMDICGQTITIPSFINPLELKDTGRQDPFPNWWSCQYKTSDYRFSVTVLDRQDTQLSDTIANNFLAFDNFITSTQANRQPDVGNIAITDTISTGITDVSLVEVLNQNSVGYTGQIFQDFSGAGVYQTATMIDNRYIVYVTYVIMGIEEGSEWRTYFDERWTFEKRNERELFREFLREEMQKPATVEKIKEINLATTVIK